jgi:hypothetical protein
MTLEEELTLIQQTRSFIGTIYSTEVVLDGEFKPQELEAISFVMRNRPAPPMRLPNDLLLSPFASRTLR